jgi:general secretion pathway protein A
LADALAETPGDADAVWRRYVALWQGPETLGKDLGRCQPRPAPGWFCLAARANFGRLAALGRPMLLLLHQEQNTRLVVLTGLGERSAALDLGTRELTVARSEVERYWRGEYLALWRAPAALPETVRLGDGGAAVDWIRATLHLPGAAPGAAFDAALENEVRRVQRDFGGQADGIVGPDTQMLLAARQADGPRLAVLKD